MSNNNQRKISNEHKALLESAGISHKQIMRESSYDLMKPKMALVGVFNVIEKFCKTSVDNITGRYGPLNVKALKLMLAALRGTLDMAERFINEYHEAQVALQTEDDLQQAMDFSSNHHNQDHEYDQDEEEALDDDDDEPKLSSLDNPLRKYASYDEMKDQKSVSKDDEDDDSQVDKFVKKPNLKGPFKN